MLSPDKAQYDAMVDDHDTNPVTYPAMAWSDTLEWLLAQGFEAVVFPTTMIAHCIAAEKVRSAKALLEHYRNAPDEDHAAGLHVVEVGPNWLGEEVAWVYASDVPMAEWHVCQRGSGWYCLPGDTVPKEYPWAHWPHCAQGRRLACEAARPIEEPTHRWVGSSPRGQA